MASPTENGLLEALRSVRDPNSGRDIVSAGLIDGLVVKRGLVQLVLLGGRDAASEAMRVAAERVLAGQEGVLNASVILTAHRAPPAAPAASKPSPAGRAGDPGGRAPLLGEVGHVIAVASGKGGVGKSTTAVNLAVALAQAGRRVGLLDADIYGPSLPRMLGMSGKPPLEGGKIQPVRAFGLLAMSIGLLVESDTAMIWRGPMVMGALEQMMGQVAWGPLDVMIVDMPPGTGDAQLTMAQRTRLSGAVIVSTPQDLALMDARRGVRMFEKVMVPVLGVVENMSSFACPHCGTVSHLFGHGGARLEAEALGVPFLGEVPLLLEIRETGDAGAPIVASAPGSAAAAAYRGIAERVWAGVTRGRGGALPRTPPEDSRPLDT